MTGTLLLAGGNYADIPMILSAKKMGLKVYTTGNRPDDLGHKYSDEYIPADFSDREAVLDLCRTLKVDGVCPSCNDFSALSSAYAAEKLNLPGHDRVETLESLMHKDKFRALAAKYGLPVPGWKAVSADEPLAADVGLKYPLIVKPVDLTGGKGMSVAHDRSELPAAVQLAAARSRRSQIVIEEYLAYDDFHHNCVLFISGGKVVFHNSDNEHYYKNKFLVWGMSVPGTTPAHIEKQIVDVCQMLCSELRLKDGI
ncbi:MAG: ATP-grasp domain-containing protein, partial [Candidatus Adiutrix sp.]|nr:ATP-grasp domain-containing protein [Candidatus Adiutrix sp.]